MKVRFLSTNIMKIVLVSKHLISGGGNQLESVNVFHEIIQQLKTVDRQSRPNYPDYFIHTAGTGKKA